MSEQKARRRHASWRRLLQLRPLLLVSLALGASVAAVADGQSLLMRLIVGWDVAALLYLALLGWWMGSASPSQMRDRAEVLDTGRWAMLVLTTFAAAASLAAITTLLSRLHEQPHDQQAMHLALGAITILPSWIFLHSMFAIHYAHGYYYHPRQTSPAQPPGGLAFPGEPRPDYWDFVYFSFVIGMTCQVSDVQIESKSMRRLALAHGVLAFFFNTVVLALTVNLAASLL